MGVQAELDAANAMIADRLARQVTIRPTRQAELETAPWTMNNTSAAAWVDELREAVCGGGGRKKGRGGGGGGGGNVDSHGSNVSGRGLGSIGGNNITTIVRMLGHWQHTSYFLRYREFIRNEVLRTKQDLRRAYYEPLLHPLDGGARLR